MASPLCVLELFMFVPSLLQKGDLGVPLVFAPLPGKQGERR